MSTATQLARPIVSVVLLAVTVLGLINVYGDDSEVKAQAQRVACAGNECPTQLTRLERNPIAQEYDIVAEPKGARKGSVTKTIRCTRSNILVGEWQCIEKK